MASTCTSLGQTGRQRSWQNARRITVLATTMSEPPDPQWPHLRSSPLPVKNPNHASPRPVHRDGVATNHGPYPRSRWPHGYTPFALYFATKASNPPALYPGGLPQILPLEECPVTIAFPRAVHRDSRCPYSSRRCCRSVAPLGAPPFACTSPGRCRCRPRSRRFVSSAQSTVPWKSPVTTTFPDPSTATPLPHISVTNLQVPDSTGGTAWRCTWPGRNVL
jgi:hypothetical protein